MTNQHRPLILIIIDGWGYSEATEGNAIYHANTPFWDNTWKTATTTLLSGSGHHVGLPKGQMGNSEVGHLNIGAGRVVPQNFTRIQQDINSGEFFKNTALCTALDKAINNNKAVHVLGLLSPGGVHSHENQIHAMLTMAAQRGATQLHLHAILDGRDTPPRSAQASIDKIDRLFTSLGTGHFTSMIGRYFAMDRDNRWDRIQHAYHLFAFADATHHTNTASDALTLAYARGESDEFVTPTSIHAPDKSPVTINEGDVVIFMNYRADRAREITHAFITPDFDHFTRKTPPILADFVTLTEYDERFECSLAYPPMHLNNVLGEYLSTCGLTQCRIAETEKYAHVTFFFNGGLEAPFKNEERILIPSPQVATYDLQPEMSAPLLTRCLTEAIESAKYDVIICNYANPDMVGHTGNFNAAVKAVETIDQCLAKVAQSAASVGGEILITADHGNVEKMVNKITGQAHTAHTSAPVPFVYIGREATVINHDSILSDIAPTMLTLLGLPIPPEMTGKSIIKLN